MLETLSNKEVKARKDHICMWCGGKIRKEEIYEVSSLKYDDIIYTWKNHIKCKKLCSELNMCDNGNGITEEDFMEQVQSFIMDNISEEEQEKFDLYGEDSVDKAIEILKEQNK